MNLTAKTPLVAALEQLVHTTIAWPTSTSIIWKDRAHNPGQAKHNRDRSCTNKRSFMTKNLMLTIGVLAILLWTPLISFAGGTVTGKVTYNGTEEKEFLFSKFPNPKFCPKNPNKELVKGDKRIMPTIRVGTDGGLQAAVVAVRDIEDKAFTGRV
jgi:hypothetical protein